ncbi:OmpA family protein [bacterium]|nr:OmpA family protein [bacterium]
MGFRVWCAAVLAALWLPAVASAQDVTLTSRDGSLSIAGTLTGYDGEFFRISSSYGPLTIDGQGVVCEGPACPDLTAPKAVIAITGASDAGSKLLPPLLAAFARARRLTLHPGPTTMISEAGTGETLAEISFTPASPAQARDALISGQALLALASTTEPDLGFQSVALDAMVPIVAPDNPTPRISTTDLARVLSGEVTNWKEIGGPDMPLVLHGLAGDSDVARALTARLGKAPAVAVSHASLADLASAVAKDPWALAVTGRAVAQPAKLLPLTDSCGFPLLPTRLAVKAQDYPLTLPVFFLTPRHRLPLIAREFLEFLSTPEAQAAVAAAGYIDRSVERQPMTTDGLRLINAIKGAGKDTKLEDLQRLVAVMDGADRLSLTFRFEGGTNTLDAASQGNLADLAQMMEAGLFKGQILTLAGFSDGQGNPAANLDLSQARADAVLAALKGLVPGMPLDQLPAEAAFGGALPMACDAVAAGRRLNRRVEVWVKPAFVTDIPVP